MFLRYIVSRLLQTALVILGVVTISFFITNLVPADPARLIAGRLATAETVENIRSQLGLDRPLVEQYWRYLQRLFQGDLGRSYQQRTEVKTLLLSRLPATLQLSLGAIVFELLIGIPLGILAALEFGKFWDKAIMVLAFIGVSAPQFALGLILLYLFAYLWNMFPLGGYGSIHHLILPALTLGISGAGWYARMMRSSLLDVMNADYVRTGVAKGLGRSKVIFKHALRNAVLPVIAMIGLDIGLLMGGVVVVESVFAWPGIGQLAWQAIQIVDIPIIMGTVLLTAGFIVLGNLLADLLYPLADPRLRYG
ncbi:MAG: ABC transporter permease [Trueperaceae bacterium]|nr:ABC transporter permease [Trueperaceae bacterium]